MKNNKCNKNYLKEYGKAARKFRKCEQYTQKQLANYCEVTQQTISKFERGVSISGISMMRILNGLYRLKINYLLGRTAELHEQITMQEERIEHLKTLLEFERKKQSNQLDEKETT